MKLALEALENNRQTHYYCEDTWYSCPKHEEGCANESEGDECNCGADKANVEIDGAIVALREALANEALAKKAENARELGLDYEPAHQEPVALFKWLPEGATHIGRISVRTSSGGSLAMTAHAFKYDNAVLKVYVTDNDNEYPGWRDAKDCFFHLNFPVLPLYTSPPAQRTWVSLTDEQIEDIWADCPIDWDDQINILTFARAIEAAHGIKENT